MLGAIVEPKVDATEASPESNDALRQVHEHTSGMEYIERIKCDIRQGVLDLKGGPWLHPGDAYSEALSINASRRASGRQLLTAIDVRDLVFRPTAFIWAPHLLHPWPLDRQNMF